ncbi:uncharacterized protein LOC111325586 [Stylophora pistillata]|uniref:uncharacterized protein LOC111325586 n=1 Tax=Stylophora pistillata TaxID=50429 RepID=UPI000C049562|nr:uncharacterized protein LOC111325586 [Stylophora pistillata]
MSHQLLLLILGTSVAWAEMQMNFPGPQDPCHADYDKCVRKAAKKPCGKVSCEISAMKCARKKLSAPPSKMSEVPKLWKHANITPIHKDGDREPVEHYRADAVVAVGSRLQQKYSRSLLNVKVEIITPGIFGKFSNESKLAVDRSVVKHFNVSMFGRATFEDLSLKGYDIVANAIGPLGKNFELTFVGSSPGEYRKVEQWFLDNTGISRNQLTIRGYCSDTEELKMMFYQSDLVALPSRTEGFGLVALEAISAGIPILVSGESGIAEALREVEGGNAVIVELDEDADEWARRISEMAEESSEEREAKARRLRENYRKVYSWRAECERFKGTIEKVVKSANGGELNIKVDVKDFEPEEQNTGIQTGILLTTESVRGQEVQQPRTSTTSATLGSVCYPQTEYLPALKEKIFLSIVENYLQTTPPQSTEEHNMFKEYAKEMRFIITGTSVGSLVITVKCESQLILEGLWIDYLSGHLGEVVQNSFVTEKILKKLNLAMLKLETTMDMEEYNACKVYFERVALRDVLSAHSYFKSTEDEAQLERWKQKTEVVESEKVKSSLPILEMSTTGHNNEGEEPQETMKDQKLNIKVDVEHVKLADHDTCSTASVSTMEPAECQKASIASGARRKRRSDTDLEDVQPLEKKVLCLIAMNYLHTTPPESRDEGIEFQEYLLDMKVHITCVSVGSLVITVKCNSLKSLEELWEGYSCGLLGKMVRDCFETEKILKELNLAELKLKTTMDIEEYNACKLYFEKNALRGVLSSEFHSKSSTSESLQKQEELKKWKQKTKIVETEEMKGTPPLTVINTTGKRKEPEEPTGKIGTSLSAKLSTAGHGKEREGKMKTLKLQEEKSE